MEFKKIQLNGFKSFAEKQISYREGLTGRLDQMAAVNQIVESLRWLHGRNLSQKYERLRNGRCNI